MKLAKSLKLKNRLVGEISRLNEIVKEHNSHDASQELVYDVNKIYTSLDEVVNKLIFVKTAIACANAGKTYPDVHSYAGTPYRHIFAMAEYKGLIETLRATSTKSGPCTEHGRFVLGGDSSKTVVYVATFKQADIDKMVASLEQAIEDCQDKLDAHNATSDLSVIDVL
jgi:hypothetical protein